MSSSSQHQQSLLAYYAREGLWGHVEHEIGSRNSSDILRWWKAIAIGYQGRLGAAIRELSTLRHSQDIEMAAMVALLDFHHMQASIDESEIDQIERDLEEEEDRSKGVPGRENGILLAAQFHLFAALREDEADARSDRLDKGRRYCKMVCDFDEHRHSSNLTGSQRRALILNAWIDISVNGSSSEHYEYRQQSGRLLEEAVTRNSRDIDWLVARAKSYIVTTGSTPERLELALEHLNEATALEAGYIPALMLKSKLLLALGDWEQSRETASRLVTEKKTSSVEALQIIALYELAHNPHNCIDALKPLAKAMEKTEASNAQLFYTTGKAMGRLAGRGSPEVLEFIIETFTKRAVSLSSHTAIYMAEVGRQERMLGQVAKALETYRQAGDLDASCEEVVLGQVYCQLDAAQIEDAESQLDFLSAIGDTMSISVLPSLSLLRAMLSWRLKPRDIQGHISALKEADRAHFETKSQTITDITQVIDSYARWDPDFILDLGQQYLEHLALLKSSFQIAMSSDEDNEIIDSDSLAAVRRGSEILERISLKLPGLLSARLMVVEAKIGTGDMDGAQRYIENSPGIEASADAQLLIARIWLAKAQAAAAASACERSVACDFRIRDNPLFILVKAQVLSQLDGNHTEAVDLLNTAMRKPGVREEESGNSYIRLTDRASIFIALAKSQTNCKCFEEANSTLAEARERFRDEPIVITKLLLAQAELAVAQHDLENALRLLDEVDADESSFLDAQKLKAQFYLKYIRDKQGYTQVYQNLVNRNPQEFNNHERLGDALMRIQAPEAAVDAYESAHELAPRAKKTRLAAKVGKALLATHDYGRATDSYIQALQSHSGELELRRELAHLFAKLRNPEAAIQVLTYTLSPAATVDNDTRDFDDDEILQLAASCSLDQLIADVRTLLLLADILIDTNTDTEKNFEPRTTLKRATHLQRIILERVRQTHSSADVSQQRKFMSTICKKCARLAKKEADYEYALQYYQEALKHDAIDAEGQIELARFHLDIRRDIDACEQLCASALRIDTKYGPAMALAAELLSLRQDYAAATTKFRQIMTNNPTDYKAMAWLIDLLRRAGKLQEAPRLLLLSERQDPRAASHPGLNYCKGKLAQYQNDTLKAVKSYNLARKDATFGVPALLALIELYLNVDGDRFSARSGSDEDDDEDDGRADSSYHQGYVSADSLRVANALNSELAHFEHLIDPAMTLRVQTVRARLLLAKLEDKRNNCDLAMQILIDILDEQKDYVPALLGMAQAFLIDGQDTKAKNALKRLTKLPYSHEYADDLERGYLLLADMYVNKNKFDMAEDLCNRCLKFNLSCGRAWETMGHIREKEASYKDAADMYEKAWLLEHETSAPIGFKLAFNYLKAKRFVEAIDICNKILVLYPEYPKIRNEILENAINSLRP